MHADSMRLIKTVRCNCKIHAWWSCAIVLTSLIVGYEQRDDICRSEASVTDIPVGSATQLQMCLLDSYN